MQLHVHMPADAGFIITVGHWTMSDQNQNLSNQTENTLDILSDGKSKIGKDKIKCLTRLCVCVTIN